jgi:hypothetical protein
MCLSAKTPVTGGATVLCGGTGLDVLAAGNGCLGCGRAGRTGAMGARGGIGAASLIGLVGGARRELVPTTATSLVRTTLESGHLCYSRSTVLSDLDDGGVCPECRWRKLARAGLYRSPYNGAMDKHTRGECVSSTKEDRKAGTLQSMPTYEREVQGLLQSMHRNGCIRDVAEALQSIQQRPSDTRSQSYRLLAKLGSLIY